jgi:hypothetical protein
MEICQPPILQLLAKVLDANLTTKCTQLMAKLSTPFFVAFPLKFSNHVYSLCMPDPNRKFLSVALKLETYEQETEKLL